MQNLIAPQSMRDLVDANATMNVIVVADNDVFKITIRYAATDRILSVRNRAGEIKERLFSSLDAVARFLRDKMQLTRYEVDATNFKPAEKPRSRPDTTRRLREAHAALSHSEWLARKVDAARAGLADGTNERIAADAWEQIRAAKQKQRDSL